MYDFDKVVDRRGTSSIKWNVQWDFGQKDGLLPFWIADTDFAAEPKILEAMKKRLDHPVLGYADPWDGVYEAIQSWWDRRHGWKPETDWMFISSGVVTAIYFNLKQLVPQGGKVMTFTPVYDPFFAAIKNSGHELVTCPLNHEDNYFTINYERAEEEFKNGVKALVLCNPHNPIARVWTEEELKKRVVDDFESRWMFGPCDLAFNAIEAAYTYGDTWMDEAAAYVQGNAKIVADFIAEKMPKVQVTKHEGTFLMWLDMSCYEMSSAKITEIMAKEYGIALGDGSHYGEQADGFMRFNIGCARETLMQGLEQLAKMYDKYAK